MFFCNKIVHCCMSSGELQTVISTYITHTTADFLTTSTTMELLCTEHTMMPQSTSSGYPHSHIVSNVTTRLLCTEQSPHLQAVSTKLHNDQRRLGTYLDQETRFMPNVFQMQKLLNEDERTQMLEIIYEVRNTLIKC